MQPTSDSPYVAQNQQNGSTSKETVGESQKQSPLQNSIQEKLTAVAHAFLYYGFPKPGGKFPMRR